LVKVWATGLSGVESKRPGTDALALDGSKLLRSKFIRFTGVGCVSADIERTLWAGSKPL
jgi:hypothetical protein